MTPWKNGKVVWGSVNATTNVVQFWTAQPTGRGFVYWWRNLLANEVLYDACLDCYKFTLDLPALGTHVAPIQVNEWSHNGTLIQNRGFAAYDDGVDIFTQS